MLLMIDTNICVYGMRRDPVADRILRRISGRSFGEIVISAITASELAYGVENSTPKHRPENRKKLLGWLELFTVLDYPGAAMNEYAAIRHHAARHGHAIGANDTLIAAHAWHIGATLITNDGDFSGIPGLKTVNWLAD